MSRFHENVPIWINHHGVSISLVPTTFNVSCRRTHQNVYLVINSSSDRKLCPKLRTRDCIESSWFVGKPLYSFKGLDKGWNFVPGPRIIESQILVQRADLLDLFLRQIEVIDLQVLDQSLLLVGLWNDQDVSLGSPSQEDLSRGDLVSRSNAVDQIVLEQRNSVLGLSMV
ncbi:hypothetical protein OGATHE_002711 [Ogataea polymorpha]|uniref:Uncharacterized protein n=1 Tax=Ogataea polymorpha TaxID=460523 RepID=A0A9P8PEQ4_9ASCO|nr:hypothetical protein OGATHE_002711 [Ogataea polymorpha]